MDMLNPVGESAIPVNGQCQLSCLAWVTQAEARKLVLEGGHIKARRNYSQGDTQDHCRLNYPTPCPCNVTNAGRSQHTIYNTFRAVAIGAIAKVDAIRLQYADLASRLGSNSRHLLIWMADGLGGGHDALMLVLVRLIMPTFLDGGDQPM
ncbi:uncharacterized protein BP01DRAFT_220119 [Aspergillus saccharolyticus JOP 1030-1]|uniref:Uncharacterized protein n=1 Tax=Aspergillus saccharolyticus JOP 1030-1 TaxID=1450539 RepID=A0A318ZJA9_9EURO|nr:hypothetical protein BP01DRAFT_220119 [Aspergillus saccharolyticus JOP 1030-1]PYH47609.1 hypothetical protein BP01DRAFT_220119 [Aspergillus saccharolyticus JOP 1030-1]